MNRLIRIILIFGILFSGCVTTQTKQGPLFKGVDPKVKPIVDEYFKLSKQNHIRFRNKVTMGFEQINKGNIVAYCTFGDFYREITIDVSYWHHSTNMTKHILLFHELTHCYCGRGHDYRKGIAYPETESARIALALQWVQKGGPRPGYWPDGCPFSLMYPVVLDDSCATAHYKEYTKEMFDRCVAF